MPSFAFQQPNTVADAVAALAAADADGRFLAGGQTLLPSMRLGLVAPSTLVDLDRVDGMKGIRVDGRTVTIGAMTRHAEIAASPDVQRLVPALAQMAGMIGDRQVRNRGTIGGSIANNDPAACYPSAALALGARIATDRRTIAAADFFRGLYETALEPGELVVSIAFDAPVKSAYQKFRQQASHFPLVGVFVALTEAGARVAVTGAGPGVFRAEALEKALDGGWSPDHCVGAVIDPAGMNSDIHADAAYRAHLIPILAKRAVAESR